MSMDALQERMELLGRSLALLATWAVVAGGLSIALDLGNIAEGEVPAIIRAAIGVVGIAAGLLTWTLRRAGVDGWQALLAWSVLQLPFVAWTTDGNAFRQVIDFLLGFSSSTTVNGVVTSMEQYGINGVGILLVIWTRTTRERWQRKIEPMVDQPATAASGRLA
jgi:hypothetical protein